MMDHHATVRHPVSGLLPSTSSNEGAGCGTATQLALAVTMLESAPLLGDTPTGNRCRSAALAYLDSVARLPHDPRRGMYCAGCPLAGPPATGPVRLSTPGFAAEYGGEFLAIDALLWAQAYRLTGDDRCLDLARGIGAFYASAPEIPAAGNTPAHVFGCIIELMVDLDELDGAQAWLPAAERYAQQAVHLLYAGGLLRGATNLWYYESQLWPGTVVYALVRLEARIMGEGAAVAPNYFHR